MDYLQMLPAELFTCLKNCGTEPEMIREVRLRSMRGLSIRTGTGEWMVGKNGGIVTNEKEAFLVTPELIRKTLDLLTGYSLYAYEEELRQGYFTVAGGHRIGVAGHAVYDGGELRRLTEIAFVNIRIAHEIRGCARELYEVLFGDGRLKHTLLFAPPGCGKTTYLRDLIRLLSEDGHTVGVADERSELAAAIRGAAQFELGMHADVMDGCPKALAMQMLLRSMNPEILAADEIGTAADADAVRLAAGSGCRVLASAHAGSLNELKDNPMLGTLWREQRFERYVSLKQQEKIGAFAVYNEKGEMLWNRS